MLQLLGFIIDCPDAMSLASFYSEITGRPLVEGSTESMALINFGEVDLAFQQSTTTALRGGRMASTLSSSISTLKST
jgi:hypothetical protein